MLIEPLPALCSNCSYNALLDLVSFVQFKKREKNHEEVLPFVKLKAFSPQLYNK